MKYLLIITLTFLLVRAHSQSNVQSAGIPDVFLIGEYEDHYLDLSREHPDGLLSIFSQDIDKAYKGWSDLLMDMEDYAGDIDFDIKGIKLWLHIYFDADGSISNLAFFPKPNSRNAPEEHLAAFFKNFVRQYRFPVTAEKGFQHSASASFPTFFHRTTPETAKKD